MRRDDRRVARHIPLGPDAQLRLEAIPDPKGTRIELRIWRASPQDTSPGRFHPTSEGLEVPVAVFKQLRAEMERVGVAAMEMEFMRPWPGGPEAA
jgi:hypothetical protein